MGGAQNTYQTPSLLLCRRSRCVAAKIVSLLRLRLLIREKNIFNKGEHEFRERIGFFDEQRLFDSRGTHFRELRTERWRWNWPYDAERFPKRRAFEKCCNRQLRNALAIFAGIKRHQALGQLELDLNQNKTIKLIGMFAGYLADLTFS